MAAISDGVGRCRRTENAGRQRSLTDKVPKDRERHGLTRGVNSTGRQYPVDGRTLQMLDKILCYDTCKTIGKEVEELKTRR